MKNLFEPAKVGLLELKNRIAMAPMTRARNADGIPSDHNALYYAQRSGAGLIITEGTAISDTAKGVLYIPGLYTSAQGRRLEKGHKGCKRKREQAICTTLACRQSFPHF